MKGGGSAASPAAATSPAPGAGSPSRRRDPELVTKDPADDDEEVYGDDWPLVDEWRRLWDEHPARGKGLEWVSTRQRILALEVAMLEDHGLTLAAGDGAAAGPGPGAAVELALEGAPRVQ